MESEIIKSPSLRPCLSGSPLSLFFDCIIAALSHFSIGLVPAISSHPRQCLRLPPGPSPQPFSRLLAESRLLPHFHPFGISILTTSPLSTISPAPPLIPLSLRLCHQPCSGLSAKSRPSLSPPSPSSLSRHSWPSLRLRPQPWCLTSFALDPALAARLNFGPCHVSALSTSLSSSSHHSRPSLRLHPHLRTMVSSSPPFILIASSLRLMERRARRF